MDVEVEGQDAGVDNKNDTENTNKYANDLFEGNFLAQKEITENDGEDWDRVRDDRHDVDVGHQHRRKHAKRIYVSQNRPDYHGLGYLLVGHNLLVFIASLDDEVRDIRRQKSADGHDRVRVVG